jgi:arylsulfatase
MFSHRAIWHDGWKAVSFHHRGGPYAQDTWELYRLDKDFSECDDVASEHPDVLERLVELWWAEAGKYDVLPLDDRGFTERAVRYQSEGSPRLRTRFSLHPGMSRIPSGAAPLFVDRSFRITAHLNATGVVPNGVIVSLGDVSGGFTLYVKDARLAFEYNWEGTLYRVEAPAGLTADTRTLAMSFEREQGLAGLVRLFVDGREIGQGDVPHTAKWFISWSPLDLGRDGLSRVTDTYGDAFAFTPGALERVDFELEPKDVVLDLHPVD